MPFSDGQKQAIQSATDASSDNPFVTESKLPKDAAPEKWPIGVSEKQKAALDKADQPGELNPFITQSKLTSQLPIGVTDLQKQALDAAENPRTGNPFITQTRLTTHLPLGIKPDRWPIGVSEEQKVALDAAHSPSAENPLATLADLGQAGIFCMTVAGGLVDLSQQAPSQGFGDLKVVANDSSRGLATLFFRGYQAERRHRYLISALPVNLVAVAEAGRLPVVNLVEFNEQGFVLQMGQPHQGMLGLGSCMIQVSEMTHDIVVPPELTLEQAIHRYYRLIQQEEYTEAWPMLSTAFRQSLI